MRIKSAVFVKSAVKPRDFPAYPHPEFAFMGRSNVGKSSLINMLAGRRDLVKVGARPGVTTTINFFVINEVISIADLPGFGYAKLPRSQKTGFLPMIHRYLEERGNLRLAFLLLDARREPGDFERDTVTLLSELEIPVALVATKCDKLSKNELRRSLKIIAETLEADIDSVFPSSSKSGAGKSELLGIIKDYSSKT